jgi:predicted Ser/Thr protein kinase
MAVTPERMIADRYSLERPIGRGGMGVVWLARDHLLDREVAIKEVTLPDTVPEHERESLRARVLREARAAARLTHPGVITLYDVLNEQGRVFIVMELIKARTLADIVAREGPLPPELVARTGLQVAFALDAAHQAGIVHRDVKPANVMVAEDGKVWLADFGIAQVQGDPKLTSTGMIVGSPAYMAPEQASGGDSGPEADLWGLGATMYYAVEGYAPFERGNSLFERSNPLAILTAVVNEPPRPPRRAGALAPIIRSLLAKDPAGRPTLRQVRIRLARIVTAGRQPAATQPTVPVALPGPPAPEPSRAPAPRAPVPVAAARAEQEERAGPGPAPEGAPSRFAGLAVRTGTASPAGAGERTGARRRLVALAVLGGLAVVALVAVVLVVALTRPLGGSGASGEREAAPTYATNSPATTRPAPTVRQTTAPGGGAPRTTSPRTQPQPQPGADAAPEVPADWARFSNPSGGYGVAYPSGWRRSTGLARHGTSFSDGTGRYIKVESASPPLVSEGGDPVPGWIQNERYWSERLPGYRQIGSVHGGTYHGMRAAVWEYTYLLNGRPTHGLNISFVSPSRSWGYSVLHLIREDRWGSSQDLIRSFEQGFSPLG